MPLSIAPKGVTDEQFDEVLHAGYRRSGYFFYQTHCPNCQACEPLRLEVENFKPTRSQKRALKLGDREFRVETAEPIIDDRRVEIFNAHRSGRSLDRGDSPVSAQAYQSFLLNASCPNLELSLWCGETLVAVSITDVGRQCLSAVYCCFDPAYSHLSPGTYAILSQIRLAKQHGFRWLYLGMFVEQNQHLSYKAKFRPHERLIQGAWQYFE